MLLGKRQIPRVGRAQTPNSPQFRLLSALWFVYDLYSPGWPQTYYVVKDEPVLLPRFPMCTLYKAGAREASLFGVTPPFLPRMDPWAAHAEGWSSGQSRAGSMEPPHIHANTALSMPAPASSAWIPSSQNVILSLESQGYWREACPNYVP